MQKMNLYRWSIGNDSPGYSDRATIINEYVITIPRRNTSPELL